MPKKRFSAEQIVTPLRQIEVSMAQGKSAPEAWQYNTIRPHSALNYRPPAPQTFAPSGQIQYTPVFGCFQGRVIARAMCTTRVYHSGGQNPLNLKEFF